MNNKQDKERKPHKDTTLKNGGKIINLVQKLIKSLPKGKKISRT